MLELYIEVHIKIGSCLSSVFPANALLVAEDTTATIARAFGVDDLETESSSTNLRPTTSKNSTSVSVLRRFSSRDFTKEVCSRKGCFKNIHGAAKALSSARLPSDSHFKTFCLPAHNERFLDQLWAGRKSDLKMDYLIYSQYAVYLLLSA